MSDRVCGWPKSACICGPVVPPSQQEIAAAVAARREVEADNEHLRQALRNEGDGTPLRIIGFMFDEAEKRGHPRYSSRHALGFLLKKLDDAEAARREGERALEEERRLRVQLSDDSQRHLDRALEAERERDEYARGAIHYRDMAADYGKSMREATEALAQARAALEDSTAMLQGLRGTWANENGAIDEQIAENRRALLAPPEGTKA
jgi:hypothetical protein